MIVKAVNGRITLLRQRLGLSQRAFGEQINRSAGYVNRIENGRSEVTEPFIRTLSESFGVSPSWLAAGIGPLTVESVGDRFRAARKNRGYTQEELANELHISRNSVGMIERRTFRPSKEVIDSLCNKLWIDKNWLLTGQGLMERTELTPFYELLKRDPAVRAHIRSFISHLDNPPREDRKEQGKRKEAREDRGITASA